LFKRKRGTLLLSLLALVALAALVAGCGGGGSSSSTSSSGVETESAEGAEDAGSTESGESSAAIGAEELQWALKYTGGKEGAASESEEPVVIGWANQEGATPAYPEMTVAAESAVRLINEELGGFDGRPIELKECVIQTAEDGQKCGAEFANDAAIDFVMVGLTVVGNESFYRAVAGKKPILNALPAAEQDVATPGVWTFNGGAVAPITGAGEAAAAVPGAKSAAVIHSNNASGTFVTEEILKPTIEAAGVSVKSVAVSDTAPGPEVESAIQASDAQNASVFVTIGLTPQCIGTYKGLAALGIEVPVVATYLCYAPEVQEGIGGNPPEGWLFPGFYDNPNIPKAENGTDTYVAAMEASEAEEKYTFTGDAPGGFIGLMTLAKFGNEIGAKNITAKSLEKSLLAYRGEVMMTPGKMECGKVSTVLVSLCGTYATDSEYDNEEWKEIPPTNLRAAIPK
jgi:branched-chain amino acid transport system substrate-binding protein